MTRSIFQLAFRQIWSGRQGRPFQWFETICWTVLALDLGFWMFDYPGVFWYLWRFRIAYWAIFLLTPMVIPAFIYGAHIRSGGGDHALLSVPLKPYQIILPRISAVFLSWLRLFAPLIILMITGHEETFNSKIPDNLDRILISSFYHLTYYPFDGPQWVIYYLSPRLHLERDVCSLPVEFKLSIISMACGQIISWITVPIMWGFWWTTRWARHGIWFLTGYFSWLIMPALLICMHFWVLDIWLQFPYALTGIDKIRLLWPIMTLIGYSGLILSIFLYFFTCIEYGRRNK